MEKLFAKGDLSDALEERSYRLVEEIKGLSNEQILGTDSDEWVIYYYDKYQLQSITLFLDSDYVKRDIEEVKIKVKSDFDSYGPEYYEVDGYKITFTIPFDGERCLLDFQPSTRFTKNFYIDRVIKSYDDSCDKIVFSLEYEKRMLDGKENHSQFINNAFNQEFIHYYAATIERINKDVDQYNAGLENTIRNALTYRKKKASDFVLMSEMLDIPLKLNPNAPNTVPIVLKKAAVKKPEMPSIRKPEKEYQISQENYVNIRRIVYYSGCSMEKGAKTFSKFSEEELRDVIISNLNSHYQGLASAETFSKSGKTDIYILFENKAAYIAECKIWHGEKKLQEAIEQLFGYITWKDLKTSIIIFNKEHKDFEKLLQVIKAFFAKNKLCLNCKELQHNELLCEFKKDADSINSVTVQVVVFDLCV